MREPAASDDLELLRRGVLKIARTASEKGEALPGEFELARLLGANRPQIRRALALLEQQGIVHRHQGAATTVDAVALRMTIRLEEQVEHSVLLSRLGYAPAVELVESSIVAIPYTVAKNLSAGVGTRGIKAVKRWTADGAPAMLAENYLAIPDDSMEIDPARSIFDTAEQVWGEPVIWEVATPGVENIPDGPAQLLGLEPGAACLTLEIIGVTRSGRRVFYAFERHHPEIVRYSLVRTITEPWRSASPLG